MSDREKNVKLELLQFNNKNRTGDAHFWIVGPKPASALNPQPYLAIKVAYRLHSNPPASRQDNQEARILSCGPQQYALFTFITEQLCNTVDRDGWPVAAEYRPKIVSMMVSILSFVELADVADPVPTVLPFLP